MWEGCVRKEVFLDDELTRVVSPESWNVSDEVTLCEDGETFQEIVIDFRLIINEDRQ